MKKGVDSFGFSSDIVDTVKPVVESIDENNLSNFNKTYAAFTLDMCEKVESKELKPDVADKHFTLIDLYVSDNFPNIQVDDKIEKITHEGMTLHDLGEDFGANLSLMKSLANELINDEN